MNDGPKLDVARREVQGITAPLERRALRWLAERMPRWVSPDGLTAVGFLALIGAGVGYALAAGDRGWLHAVNLCLLVNWFGDSLDGSIARFRNQSRPRYGFYLDHMVDALGAFFLLGGMGALGPPRHPPRPGAADRLFPDEHQRLPRHPHPRRLQDLVRALRGDRAPDPARPREPGRARLARGPASGKYG